MKILKSFKSFINFAKKNFSKFNIFKKLKFGQTSSVLISIPYQLDEVKVSSVGYYHEWLIMFELLKKFENTKTDFEVIFPQKSEITTRVNDSKQKYSVEIPSLQPEDKDKFLSAVDRSEKSAPNLADKIFQDIMTIDDIIFMEQIIIEHVGGAGLGKGGSSSGGKADIRVSAKKKNETEVKHMINASIKIAVGGWITLLTTSSLGLINKMFFPDQEWSRGSKAIVDFEKNIRKVPELNSLYNNFLENEVKRADLSLKKDIAKKQKDKTLTKKIEKEMITHINAMGDFIYGDLFDYYYSKNKEEVNRNFLKALGLDGGDQVYYTLVQEQTKKNPETHYYMSSKTSEAYKELYGNLASNFTISFGNSARGSASATRTIILKDETGKVFWKSPIQFQQSGAGSWKLFMQDFTEVVQKHNETKKHY